MGLRIKHRTQCYYCSEWFEPGHAFLQRKNGKWLCQCDRCFEKKREAMKDRCEGKHSHPVHFNRGKHGHVWICIACGIQLSGPSLPLDEREALIEFAKLYNKEIESRKGATAHQGQGDDDMETQMQITVPVKANATNQEIATALRWRANLFDGMEPKAACSVAATSTPAVTGKATKAQAAPAPEPEETEEDEDFAPKKSAGKKAAAAAFDDEDDSGEEAEAQEASGDDDEEDFMTPPVKTKKAAAPKAKKLTVDDVNDACKERAARTGGKEGRAEVLALLKKHFKTASVSEVKPEDYEKLVKIMKA